MHVITNLSVAYKIKTVYHEEMRDYASFGGVDGLGLQYFML